MAAKVTTHMRELGLLARTYQVIEVGPPLLAGRREIETIVDVIERTVHWFAGEVGIA
jgi:adenosylmethionine-8-amino-7-oxononanoate aminotransferase